MVFTKKAVNEQYENVMKNQIAIDKQFHNVMPLVVIGVLALFFIQGCTTNSSSKNVSQAQVNAKVVSVTSEARNDFDEAMRLVKAEEYDQAVIFFKKVIKAAPDNAVAYINIALVYKKQGKLKLVEENLKQAITVEPENPVAHNEYALLYRKTGRFSEARSLYEKVLGKYPNFYMAHKNLGILCDLYIKDYQCAYDHYVIYAEAMPADKSVQIWIADLHKRLGK
jgi:tetratricopeptide (TPR) repeat protein